MARFYASHGDKNFIKVLKCGEKIQYILPVGKVISSL